MDIAWEQKLCTKQKRVIKKLEKGRDFATQLQILLHKPIGDDGSASAKEFVMQILRSFTDTLSLLRSCDSDEVCQIPATTHLGSTLSGDRICRDSGENRKGLEVHDRRGRYKRRKTTDSWMTVSPTIEDGYAWRKYGQKGILNAKYPRCYYRCTHRDNQGCRAMKQVQQIEDYPNMNQITYFGNHTCKQIQKAPQLISDSVPLESYNLLNVESKIPNKQHSLSFSNMIPSAIKGEYSKGETQSGLSDNLWDSSSTLWQDLVALESGTTLMGSDHEDVVSSGVHSSAATSSHGLDMEILSRSVDFDNDFHFDETEFS